MKISVFWFRRDLRLDDNAALSKALESGFPVLPVFIFDKHIIDKLPRNDARINYIYGRLVELNRQLREKSSSLRIYQGKPEEVWRKLLAEYDIHSVHINSDYEPYASERDNQIEKILAEKRISLLRYKDQVIFEKSEIVKDDGKPYTVYTPYKKKWLEHFNRGMIIDKGINVRGKYYAQKSPFPTLDKIGFQPSSITVKDYQLADLAHYDEDRHFPGKSATSQLSPHLRFGTISIRQAIRNLGPDREVFLSELIWREFFMQILHHFPHVVRGNFNAKYNAIKWLNNEKDFLKWCRGETGYPLVDAGMRQLNESGYMHNRVRMVTASFLCKHLLIDWRWGEAYFAEKLLDYDLAANNGNWQWVAGTGCDAAPYFRVFNPSAQLKKFDPQLVYVKKWISNYNDSSYIAPMVEHKYARQRALEAYKTALGKSH